MSELIGSTWSWGRRVFCLLVLCLFVGGEPALAGTQSDPALRRAVERAMTQHRGAAAAAAFDVAVSDLPPMRVDVERTSADGRWVFGSVVIPVPSGRANRRPPDAAPEAALFLAYRADREWYVALEVTSEFMELMRRAPESVVLPGERPMFENQFKARSAGGTGAVPKQGINTGLMLPWRPGDAWYMGGGPHGNGGYDRPFTAIDFNGGNGEVLAARGGHIYYFCRTSRSSLIRVLHDNGYSTQYYHLRNITQLPTGTEVTRGTYLGHIGTELPCGGSATGDHVHFVLMQGDTYVPVNGMTIGGWTFFEGAQAYGGYAVRGTETVYAGSGRTIRNYAPDDVPPGPDLPTGIVRAGGPNNVARLRSGPTLASPVIGTRRDGEIIRISCTGRGDVVDDAPLGRTTLWDRLDTGEWINDGLVDTGTNNPVAPDCGCATACSAVSSPVKLDASVPMPAQGNGAE